MNWRAIFAIVYKDVKVVLRTKGVLIPLIVVPLLVSVLLPALFALLPQLADAAGLLQEPVNEFSTLLERFPSALTETLSQYSETETMIVLLAVYYFAPMFLILPLMVSSVIAADSLAGEKERKTLEALLYTPTTDRELLLAKFLAAWIPAVAVAWLGFLVYALVLNGAAWPVFGRVFFPNGMWWLLALWVAPAVAGIGLGFTVLISARVGTFQEAYQLGGMVVLPVVALMISQGMGVLYFGPELVFLLGLGAWVLDLGLFWIGAQVLQRSNLIARL